MPPRRKSKKSMWDLGPLDARETPFQIEERRAAESTPLDESGEGDEAPGPKVPFPDLDGVRRDAEKLGPGLLGLLLWLDAKFVDGGQVPLSPWWRAAVGEFFVGDRTWAVFMVGRGGGKSTSLVRVAILYVLFGGLFAPRSIPPGQRWTWPFLSVHTNDAARRITEASALLNAIHIANKPKGHVGARVIEMVDALGNDVAFVSQAATIAGVSGPSSLGGTLDEEAKLRDRSHNANPATEIIASMIQTFRGRPGMRAIRCSSAWREEGSHYQAVREGTTAVTFCARIGADFFDAALSGLLDVAAWEEAQGRREAAQKLRARASALTPDSPNVPTWVANPTIPAVASRVALEGAPLLPEDAGLPRWAIWLRENASFPITPDLTVAGASTEEFLALGELNRSIARRTREGNTQKIFRDDGLQTIPSEYYDPPNPNRRGTL